MKKFKITVWYRFSRKGIQEKEFEEYEVEAENIYSAIEKIKKEHYACFHRIPFSFIHNGEKVELKNNPQIK